MEEREKIIKKTAELIVNDVLKIVKPVKWWSKAVSAGIICGASSLFLVAIRNRVRMWFNSEIFLDDYKARKVIDNVSWFTCALLIAYFLINLAFSPLFLKILNPYHVDHVGIKFLMIINFVGIFGEGFHYLLNKKVEAENLLKKKEKPTDIKIEGKKKEPPKIVGRVNT